VCAGGGEVRACSSQYAVSHFKVTRQMRRKKVIKIRFEIVL